MIKVGIVGTGIIAAEHAKAVLRTPGLMLVASADVVPARLNDYCDAFGVSRRYRSGADLIEDPDLDLVVITTPPAAHEELAVTALEAGKYVLCEKPLAHTLASASRMVEAELRHPGRMATSYQMRYQPSARRLIWLCQNGWIGDVQSALIERHSFIPHSSAEGYGWWGSWEVTGGGVLITQLIHELDLVLLALGRPLWVSAQMGTLYTDIESEDWVEATIRFQGGVTTRCAASVNSGRRSGSLVITGSTGTASLSGEITMADSVHERQALRAVDVALPETRSVSMSLPSRAVRKLGRRLGVKSEPELTPHAQLYGDIAQSVRRRVALPVPPVEALKSLQLCAAIYESALKGRKVDLPLDSTAAVFHGVSKSSYRLHCRSHRWTASSLRAAATGRSIRVGLIGLDTTHATTFTKLLHDPYDPHHIPGAIVTAAFPGGSPDMPTSASRVGGFTAELRDRYGVSIMESPQQVADSCDLVFILASDGRTHPGLFRSVAGRGRPVFVDKPFAVTTADAESIFTFAAQTGTKIFASSGFRYADGLVDALSSIRSNGETVLSCCIRFGLHIELTQGRYFWYGIHASEMLFAIMGKSVREVEVASDDGKDTLTVCHEDGRQSTLVGNLTDGRFRVSIETDKRRLEIDLSASMESMGARLLASALDVLTDGDFPQLWRASSVGSVSDRHGRALDPDQAETMEVIRLLEAAQCSHATGQTAAL